MITKTTNPELGWVYFDSNGVRMPWYTLPCLEWLDGLDLKDKFVFEYGVGYSTSWFESRGAICYAVESNKEWYDECLSGVTIMFETQMNKYTKSILDILCKFDIIVIDGVFRDDCTEYALKRLNKGGYLIVDNFEQPSVQADWPKTRELTKDLPLTLYKQPDHPSGWQTAVWKI